MKTKERFLMYVKVAERAEEMNIYNGQRMSLLMDIESADNAFNLRLEDLLKADNFNFAHDVVGIVNNINRNEFPAKDFGYFVPRFASNTEN